ncbi:MAG: hypothetical protein ABSE89_01365 [Sedimentisphaerales bacterium]
MYYGVCHAASGCGAEVAPLVAVPIMIFFFMALGLFFTAIFLFKLFLWWRVFSKTGYSGAFGLLLLVPFGAFIMLCILAFSTWPITKKPEQKT